MNDPVGTARPTLLALQCFKRWLPHWIHCGDDFEMALLVEDVESGAEFRFDADADDRCAIFGQQADLRLAVLIEAEYEAFSACIVIEANEWATVGPAMKCDRRMFPVAVDFQATSFDDFGDFAHGTLFDRAMAYVRRLTSGRTSSPSYE
jgi:hypothetical protein